MNGTKISLICPVRNLLFCKKYKEKRYLSKISIVFLYTHKKYKIPIRAQLNDFIKRYCQGYEQDKGLQLCSIHNVCSCIISINMAYILIDYDFYFY